MIEKTLIVTGTITPEQQYEWDIFVEFMKDVAVRYVTLNIRIG